MEKYQNITEEEARSYLAFYVTDAGRLDAYIARLHSAPNLKAVERIFITMVRDEGIPTDLLTHQEFYMTVRVFFGHLKAARTTLHEHFVNVQHAVKARPSSADRRALLKSALSGGIEVGIPKPGEKLRCTIELVITVSREQAEGIEIPAPKPGEEVRYTVELVIRMSKDSQKLLVTVAGAVAGCLPLPLFGLFYQPLSLFHTDSYTLTGTPAELVTSLEQFSALLEDDKGVKIEYRSPLTHRKRLTVRQALDLLRQEPQ